MPTYNLLKYTLGVVPIVAGADKFTNILTVWTHYINSPLIDMLPFSPEVFMMIVGVIEIIAGIIVLKNAEVGGYIVSGWLVLVALSLIVNLSYLDVAVRDLVMAIASFSMARLTKLLV